MLTDFDYRRRFLELLERSRRDGMPDDDFFSQVQDLNREFSYSSGSFSSFSFISDVSSDDIGNLLNQKNRLKKEQKEISETMHQLIEENLEENQELIEKLRERLKEIETELRTTNLKLNKHTKLEIAGAKIENTGNRISNTVNGIVSSLQRMYHAVNDLVDPWAKVDQAASNYAKTVATSAKGRDNLRKQTIDNVVKNKIAASYDLSTPELIEAQMDYSKGIGRNAKLSDEAQVVLGTMNKVYGGAEKELSVMFEKFGVGPIDTGKHLGKMFKEASKSGLSLEKYASNVNNGLRLAQRYTFSGGLKAMEAMAKRATEIHMDMQQIQILADKVGTIEGSITTSAKLQVLGGPFAGLADPMGMFSEAWGNIEGLEKRLEGFTSQLGSFNRTTGEVEISAFNKQRLRAMAEATGMDFQQLIEQTQQQAKLGEIKSQIARSANASQWDDATQELFRNTATFENGKAGVSINGEFKTIDELTSDDLKQLKEETQSESEDIKEIANMLRDYFQVKSSAEKQKEARLAKLGEAGLGPAMKSLTDKVGHTNWILSILNGFLIANIAGSFIGGFGGFLKGNGAIGSKILGKFGAGSGGAVAQTIYGGGTVVSGGGVISRIGAKRAAKKAARGFVKEGGTFLKTSTGKIYRQNSAGQLFNLSGKKVSGGAAKNIIKSGQEITKKEARKLARTKITQQATKTAAKTAAKEAAKTAATSEVVKTTTKSVSKQAAKKASTTIATQAASKKTTNVALQKTGEFVAKNLAKQGAAAFMKGGSIAGIVGAVGNIATDMAVEKGKIKKGGKGHAAMKVGFSMLEYGGTGAMIGTMLGGPVIGTAIGAGIGAVVGATKIAKIRREMALDNKMAARGIERHGDYGAKKLKKIEKGLEGKHISRRLRRKMEREGDIEMLAEIDKAQAAKKQAKEEKREKRRKNRLEFLQAIKPGGGIAKKFEKANFEVQVANFGGKAFRAFGKAKEASAFSRFKEKQLSKSAGVIKNPLSSIVKLPFSLPTTMFGLGKNTRFFVNPIKQGFDFGKNLIKQGKLEDGNSDVLQNLRRLTRNDTDNSFNGRTKIEPIDIKINGTLKLEGGNGKNVDIIDEIKNNPKLLDEITKLLIPTITKQLNKSQFGGYKVTRNNGINMPSNN